MWHTRDIIHLPGPHWVSLGSTFCLWVPLDVLVCGPSPSSNRSMSSCWSACVLVMSQSSSVVSSSIPTLPLLQELFSCVFQTQTQGELTQFRSLQSGYTGPNDGYSNGQNDAWWDRKQTLHDSPTVCIFLPVQSKVSQGKSSWTSCKKQSSYCPVGEDMWKSMKVQIESQILNADVDDNDEEESSSYLNPSFDTLCAQPHDRPECGHCPILCHLHLHIRYVLTKILDQCLRKANRIYNELHICGFQQALKKCYQPVQTTLAFRKSWEWQASSSVRRPVETYPAKTPVRRLEQRTRHSGGVDWDWGENTHST